MLSKQLSVLTTPLKQDHYIFCDSLECWIASFANSIKWLIHLRLRISVLRAAADAMEVKSTTEPEMVS